MEFRIIYDGVNGVTSYSVVAYSKTHAMLKLHKDIKVVGSIYNVDLV